MGNFRNNFRLSTTEGAIDISDFFKNYGTPRTRLTPANASFRTPLKMSNVDRKKGYRKFSEFRTGYFDNFLN